MIPSLMNLEEGKYAKLVHRQQMNTGIGFKGNQRVHIIFLSLFNIGF